MTTIVVTETEIVHDTQASLGDVRQLWPDEEKAVVHKGRIYCGAGDADAIEALPEWLARGGKLEEAPGGEWEVVVVYRKRNGKLSARYHDNEQKRGFETPFPACIGSGANFALSILTYQRMKGLPQSAFDAVSVACAIDIKSGGEIKRLFIDDLLKKAEKPKTERKPRAPKDATPSTADTPHA